MDDLLRRRPPGFTGENFKSDGFKGDGSEVEDVASVGRTFGDLPLAANAVAGKGVSGADAGVDLEGGLAARLALGRS